MMAAWAGSYQDTGLVPPPLTLAHHDLGLVVQNGQALLSALSAPPSDSPFSFRPAISTPSPTFRCLWNAQIDTGQRLYLLQFPLWLTPLLPAACLARHTLRFLLRPPPGHCPACRYDLRASPGPWCPECGNPIDRPASNRA